MILELTRARITQVHLLDEYAMPKNSNSIKLH